MGAEDQEINAKAAYKAELQAEAERLRAEIAESGATPETVASALWQGAKEAAYDVGLEGVTEGAENVANEIMDDPALGPLISSIGKGGRDFYEWMVPSIGIEAGSLGGAKVGNDVGKMAANLIPNPFAKAAVKVAAPAIGSMIGYTAGDSVQNVISGEPQEMPGGLEYGVAAGLGSAGPIGHELSAWAGPTVKKVANAAIAKLSPKASQLEGWLRDKLGHVQGEAFEHAMGFQGSDFLPNDQGHEAAVGALTRMDERGFFSPANLSKLLGVSEDAIPVGAGLAGSPGKKIGVELEQSYLALLKEKERIIGRKLDDMAGPIAAKRVPLEGTLGEAVRAVDKDHKVPVQEIMAGWDDLEQRFLGTGAKARESQSAARIFEKEREDLIQTALPDKIAAKRRDALIKVKNGQQYIKNNGWTDPSRNIADDELEKIFNIKYDKDGEVIRNKSFEKFQAYKDGIRIERETRLQALASDISFGDSYKKRVALERGFPYGSEVDPSVAKQVEQGLATVLRGSNEKVAAIAGDAGKAFLTAKQEFSDWATVFSRVKKSVDGLHTPISTMPLGMGIHAVGARSIAHVASSSNFGLWRTNYAHYLKDSAGLTATKAVGGGLVAGMTGGPWLAPLGAVAGPLFIKQGQATRNASKWISAASAKTKGTRTVFKELSSVVGDALVLDTLEDAGYFDDDTPYDIEQLASMPEVQEIVRSSYEQAGQITSSFEAAVRARNTEAALTEFGNIAAVVPRAFEDTEYPSELKVDGQRRLTSVQDIAAYGKKVRGMDLGPIEKATKLDMLNKNGAIE
jgi:hypothetical protein